MNHYYDTTFIDNHNLQDGSNSSTSWHNYQEKADDDNIDERRAIRVGISK